jgi:exonuclease SbcD
LDLSYASSGFGPALASQRRQSVRDAFRSILERAKTWPADAVLIAGDLFEVDRVSADTLAFTRDALELAAPVSIYIAPGNHDPYVGHSPYVLDPWPDNVHIFSSPHWASRLQQNVPLTVHGFAFDGYDISRNPFSELRVPKDGRIHVAVAHGSERGSLPESKQAYAPFRAEEVAQPELAYLALGHYHGYSEIATSKGTLIRYSGAPEGHDFSEQGMHHFVEVEINGANVVAKPVPSSRAIYVAHTIDCTGLEHANQLVDAIRNLPHEGDLPHLVRITLTGLCLPSISHELQLVNDIASSHFQYFQLINETSSLEDFDALASENTTLGEFMRRINSEIRDTADPARRRMLERARETGLAACRGQQLATLGLERTL